ncbi:MAG: PorT family protein [Candidatus Aminicenantes bacterium]|nr:PorT family protein [Candidatus Aminicenantes bacterium]
MNKLASIFIVVSLCGILPVYSQSSDVQTNTFSVGIIGGLNFADMHFPHHQGSEDQRISALLRFGAGAVLDIRLSNNFFVRLEPMYLQKGGKIEEGNDPFNQPEGRITSSSIEIPLLMKYTFGNNIQPYLIGGPTLAYNLKSDIDFDLIGLKFKGNLKDITKTFDLGLTWGLGLQVPVGFGTFFLEGRYTFGLINQRKSGITTLSSNGFHFDLYSDKEEDKYTKRGFQILAGVLISIGKH